MNPQPIATAAGAASRAGCGPVERAAIALLDACPAAPVATAISERSPVGMHALRLTPIAEPGALAADSCRSLASWLDGRAWVDELAVRPPNVYVRVGVDTLRRWVVAGYANAGDAERRVAAAKRVTLHVGAEATADTMTLEHFRAIATCRSLVELLKTAGFDAALAPQRPEHPAPRLRVEIVPQPFADESGAGTPAALQIGGVDVVHGPLRARFGGAVNASDLMQCLTQRRREADEGEHAPVGVADRTGYAEAALRFILLRITPARHMRLDDARLAGEAASFDAVLSALELARAHAPGEPDAACTGGAPLQATHAAGSAGDTAIRELAIALGDLERIALRAASELDPALVTRYLRALAECCHTARPHLAGADPLWQASRVALERALVLAGLGTLAGASLPTAADTCRNVPIQSGDLS
ncbi:hypothetical protein WL80_02615 [Burkholderia ubonensis]|uniref:hypothetical protein n=1 Tax=Burkholderia ubonensis TaxID=101571 RepID=UPI00075D0834|nr:hypothetical protein [Burkholderia ubonensis]KWF00505.1 hypothetical protein WL80_02615 [Burkholderia ubonensis]OJB18803.1 hypothetical protein BGV54_20225 [Burkholderia ubonensis]